MLWFHPVLQAVLLVPATMVLFMGLVRFRVRHLGASASFAWKRHVFWGKVVLVLWLAGYALGLAAAWRAWGSIGLTGGHFPAGTLMVPLALIGLATGLALDNPGRKRTLLPLFHGLVNTALWLLALYQAYSGLQAVRLFLLP